MSREAAHTKRQRAGEKETGVFTAADPAAQSSSCATSAESQAAAAYIPDRAALPSALLRAPPPPVTPLDRPAGAAGYQPCAEIDQA